MQKKTHWSVLGHFTLLSWALVCLVVFMYYPGAISQIQDATFYEFSALPEKLSRIPVAKYFLDLLAAILGIAFYGAACISLGTTLSPLFHLDRVLSDDPARSRAALIPTCFLLGNAVFSVIFLTLATGSHLSRVLSITILIIGLLAGARNLGRLYVPTLRVKPGFGKIVFFSSLIILAGAIFQSSARLSYDASAMYSSVAKLTALENHAEFYMENSFPVSVLHSVIQSSVIMQVFGDQTARMVSWLFGVVIVAIAVSLAEAVAASSLARPLLAALILTSTAFIDQMGDGKVDLFSTAYSLAAVFWLVVNSGGQQDKNDLYALSGFFVGFSSILRPYNAFLLGVFVLVYAAQGTKFNRAFFPRLTRQLAWMAAGAVGWALFHFYINEVILHSPLAFLNSLKTVNPNNAPWDYKPESEWLLKALYPFVVTFKNSGASLGNITPLVVVFLPALLVSNIRKTMRTGKEMSRLVLSASLALLAWILVVFSIVEVRYVMFLWIILFLFIAEIIAAAIEAQRPIIKGLAICSVLVLMSFIFARSLYISVSTYSPMDDQGNPICFDTDHCRIITTINGAADPGDRVLTLSGFRYYLRHDLFACSTGHEEFRFFQKLNPGDTELFWSEVYRRGYKFIAFEEGYVTDSAQISIIPAPRNTPPWIRLEPIFGNPGDMKIAYRIDAIDPPGKVEWTCRQDEKTGIWKVESLTP